MFNVITGVSLQHLIKIIASGMLALLALPAYAAQVETVPAYSGTGFFINPEYLITNEHVVHHNCSQIQIYDRTKLWGTGHIVATDITHDLALIRTPKWPRDTATLRRDYDNLKVGDVVIAVGYPLERIERNKDYESVTAHIVNTQASFGDNAKLQITHAVKQGYSGGALLDNTGKVVGVVKGIAKVFETDTVNGKEVGEHRLVQEADEAINLTTLMKFLVSNNVTYRTARAEDEKTNALDFTINIECLIDDK